MDAPLVNSIYSRPIEKKNSVASQVAVLGKKKAETLERKQIIESALEYIAKKETTAAIEKENTNLENALTAIAIEIIKIEDEIDDLDKLQRVINIAEPSLQKYKSPIAPVNRIKHHFVNDIQYAVTRVVYFNETETIMSHIHKKSGLLVWNNIHSDNSYIELIKDYYPVFEMFDIMATAFFANMMMFYDSTTSNIVVAYINMSPTIKLEKISSKIDFNTRNQYFQKYFDLCRINKSVTKIEIYDNQFIVPDSNAKISATLHVNHYLANSSYIEFSPGCNGENIDIHYLLG